LGVPIRKKEAAMFIFQRSIAGPLVALAVSAVLVVLDAMFQVSLP
jgi:hypothetical protein